MTEPMPVSEPAVPSPVTAFGDDILTGPLPAMSITRKRPRCKSRYVGTYQCSGSVEHTPGLHYANFIDAYGGIVTVEWRDALTLVVST